MTVDPDVVDMIADTARRILDAGGDPERLVAELTEGGIADDVANDSVCAGRLFELQGQLLGHSTLLDLMLAGAGPAPGTRVVLPRPGRRDAPASDRPAERVLRVDGIVAHPQDVTHFLVHTAERIVRVPAAALTVAPADGLDAQSALAQVHGDVAAADVEHIGAGDWRAVAGVGAIALAHELVGAGQRALDNAVEHVSNRRQFSCPIAALQAVRHRLAMVHVELEAARALLTVPDPDEITALAAKAAAGRAALDAVAAAQQVSGAMGFTAEQGLHRTVRRVLVLEALFGSADELEIEIGALLAEREDVHA